MGVDRVFPARPGGRRLRRRSSPRCARRCAIPAACASTTPWGCPGCGWCRKGPIPADGAYLAYPLTDLLRLLALESARHNAIVVGEDLGTVPAGFRETLDQDGVHGMRVLWFERGENNSFAPPDAWDASAPGDDHDARPADGRRLVARHRYRGPGGHAAGWAPGSRPRMRRPSATRDRAALWQRFAAEGLVEGAAPPPEDDRRRVVDAALAFVARTRSPLCLLPVEDLLGQEEQPNLPGTVDEHPNWRRRLPGPAEALLQARRRRRGSPRSPRNGRGRESSARLAIQVMATCPQHDAPRHGRERGAAPPRATMRLQLHAGFTFADAARLVPYLAGLGISHLYASPILTARAGSMHGYDVVDPTRVNPELGGEAGLRDLVATLRAAGLGLIVDIVPNHMAVGGSDNAWWLDVLRHGPASRYASYFDIDWNPADPALRNKLLAPFLGQPYGEALQAGRPATRPRTPPARRSSATTTTPIQLPRATMPRSPPWATPPTTRPPTTAAPGCIACWNGSTIASPGGAPPATRSTGAASSTSTASPACASNDTEVFEATHATLFRLYAEGLIDGMRVDHVDGLTDPPGYCRRLRARLEALTAERPADAPAARPYIVVEKILGAGESLPADWGVDGTSGYDFMDQVSAVQHDPEAERSLAFFWSAVSGRPADFATEEVLARRQILERGLRRAARGDRHHAAPPRPAGPADPRHHPAGDPPRPGRAAGAFPGVSHLQRRRPTLGRPTRRPSPMRWQAAKADAPISLHPVLDRIDRWLGGEDAGKPGAALRQTATRRFQQLSAPVAAKAVEDTAFYRYARLLSRNDVGFDAGRSAPSRPSSMPPARRGRQTSRTRCWPPRRTTTSAARMCAPGWRC